MIVKAIRWILARILIGLNAIFRPIPLRRAPEVQTQVDAETSHMSLYQFEGCPFCIRVRRSMTRLNLHVELRDPRRSEEDAQALVAGGGKRKVPCLRIAQNDGDDLWMYESHEIIQYLNERFAPAQAA